MKHKPIIHREYAGAMKKLKHKAIVAHRKRRPLVMQGQVVDERTPRANN